MYNILIVANKERTSALSEIIALKGRKAYGVSTSEEALAILQREYFDILVIDDHLSLDETRNILKAAVECNEQIYVNLFLHTTCLKDYIGLINPVTWNIYEQGQKTESLFQNISFIIDRIKKQHRINYLQHRQKNIYQFSDIVHTSKKMSDILSLLEKVAPSDATVMILGESGTGKELIAAATHYSSNRSKENFVAVNCAALHESLLESELFGHEKGAYTGANAVRIGRFEQANAGTIFLDEIGDMSLSIQAKVLRVIQNRSFERLGGNRTINVNVRIIAATNRNLKDEIARGAFREDLYYRLAVVPIILPPLRERGEDILPLAKFFLRKYGYRATKEINDFTPASIKLLEEYKWPGNVRELENIVERAVLISNGPHIDVQDILISDFPQGTLSSQTVASPEQRYQSHNDVPMTRKSQITLPDEGVSLHEVERDLIVQALQRCHGRQNEAAKLLHISSRVINYKIKIHKIAPVEYK
ncbi:MAG: sigma-54 interaction domain-containing protein [bacterium]